MPTNDRKAPKKASAKRAGAKGATAKGRVAASASRSTATSAGKPGDLIVIESEKVGSPPREGEVLEVIHGQVSVSYLVRWQDGHQSLIAPGAGNTRIVPS